METGTNIENRHNQANNMAAGSAEAPMVVQADGPGQALGELPRVAPEEGPGEAPGELPRAVQADGPGEAPGELPRAVQADGPGEAPGELPRVAPGELPRVAPRELPRVAPEEGPGEAPRELPGQVLADGQLYGLILYDGVCGLCNHFVKTVLDRDPDGRFQFTSLQSTLGQSILTSMDKDPSQLNTIYLVKGYGQSRPQILTKAKAALDIFGQLRGPIRLLKIFSFLPAWLLNIGYDLIAANRYRFFGRLDVCPVPDPAHLKRFLDQ